MRYSFQPTKRPIHTEVSGFSFARYCGEISYQIEFLTTLQEPGWSCDGTTFCGDLLKEYKAKKGSRSELA